jgi:large subunit ribosomal protein L15
VKLHDLRPAPGSRKERTRVGRGISAGKGKTAGRGTKGQKSRAGGSIPAWFEGGQTPLHMRVPKLRGFKQRDRVDYQVVNVGRISAYVEAGRFGVERDPGPAGAPVTVNSEVLRASGLIGSDRRPVKILGGGDVTGKLFVAADAFTRSAREKIEGAGGFVQVVASTGPTTATLASAAESALAAAPETAPTLEAETASASGAARAVAQDAEPGPVGSPAASVEAEAPAAEAAAIGPGPAEEEAAVPSQRPKRGGGARRSQGEATPAEGTSQEDPVSAAAAGTTGSEGAIEPPGRSSEQPGG